MPHRDEPAPFNPLLAVGLLLCLGAIIACGVVWSLAEPAEVNDKDSAGLGTERARLDLLAAVQKKDLEGCDAQIAQAKVEIVQLRARTDAAAAKAAGIAPAEVAALQDRVAQLNIQIDSLESQQRTVQLQADFASGQLKAEVIADVNNRLVKISEDATHFVCGTQINGFYFTSVKNRRVTAVTFGKATTSAGAGGFSLRGQAHPNLAAYSFSMPPPRPGEAPPAKGFTAADFELKPQDGQIVYCVCHQVIGDKVLDNTVVSGVLAGTLNVDGHLYLKASLPNRPEMAGAPIVTAQGKLVGILMPKSLDVEDLNLVVPVQEILQNQPR